MELFADLEERVNVAGFPAGKAGRLDEGSTEGGAVDAPGEVRTWLRGFTQLL